MPVECFTIAGMKIKVVYLFIANIFKCGIDSLGGERLGVAPGMP
jgi:hypothetical protein